MSEIKHCSSNIDIDSASRRNFVTKVGAGAVLGAVGSLFPAIVRSQAADTIKIGFVVPLTGPYGVEAQAQVKGAELAVKEFNDAGGLNKRKAELLVRDDKLNPGEAATRTLELIEKDKVGYIVGSLSAAVQLSINNTTKQRGVVFVSISQSDTINEASDWSKYTFHEALNPHMTAGAVARYVFPKYGKRAVVLAYDAAYGAEATRAVQRAAKPHGVQFVEIIKFPIGLADYSAYFPRILAAKPDVLVVANFGRDQLNCFKQATDFGLKKQMRIAATILSSSARTTGGHEAFRDIIGAASYYWALEDSEPSAKAFNAKYRTLHKTMPTDYAAYGYCGVRQVLESMKAAASTQTEKVIEALRALKYDFYKGPQHYRRCDHQSVQSVLILESKGKSEAKNDADTLKILGIERFDESKLRSCAELGHKA